MYPITPTFFLYPPPEVRKFIRLCKDAQVLGHAIDAVLNQFLMSIFLYASGEDVAFDDERIRLTIEMNFVLYHPPWRNDWGELQTESPRLLLDDKTKLAIIEQGILTYHALRTNHSLIEYLRHLASKANSYAQAKRAKTGHLMISAEPLPPTY